MPEQETIRPYQWLIDLQKEPLDERSSPKGVEWGYVGNYRILARTGKKVETLPGRGDVRVEVELSKYRMQEMVAVSGLIRLFGIEPGEGNAHNYDLLILSNSLLNLKMALLPSSGSNIFGEFKGVCIQLNHIGIVNIESFLGRYFRVEDRIIQLPERREEIIPLLEPLSPARLVPGSIKKVLLLPATVATPTSEATRTSPEVVIPEDCQKVFSRLANTEERLPEHPRGLNFHQASLYLSFDLSDEGQQELLSLHLGRERDTVIVILDALGLGNDEIDPYRGPKGQLVDVAARLMTVKSIAYRMRRKSDNAVEEQELNKHGREVVRGLQGMFPRLDVARFLNIYFGFGEVKSQEEVRGEEEKPRYSPLVYLGRVEAGIPQPQLEGAPWDLALLAQSMKGLPLYRSREVLTAAPALDRLIDIFMLDNEIPAQLRALLPIASKFGLPIQIPITARDKSGTVREFAFTFSRGEDGLFRLGIEYNYMDHKGKVSPLNTTIIFMSDGRVITENREDLEHISTSAHNWIFLAIRNVISSSSTVTGCSSETLREISAWWDMALSGQFTIKLLAAGEIETKVEVPAELPDSTRRFLEINSGYMAGFDTCPRQPDEGDTSKPENGISWLYVTRVGNTELRFSRTTNDELRFRLGVRGQPEYQYILIRGNGTIVLDPAWHINEVSEGDIQSIQEAYDVFFDQVRTIARGEYQQGDEIGLTRDQAQGLVAWYGKLIWEEETGGGNVGDGPPTDPGATPPIGREVSDAVEVKIPEGFPEATKGFLSIDPQTLVERYINCTPQSDEGDPQQEDRGVQWLEGFMIGGHVLNFSRTDSNELRFRLWLPRQRIYQYVIVRGDRRIILDPVWHGRQLSERDIEIAKDAYEAFINQAREVEGGQPNPNITQEQAQRLVVWFERLKWAKAVGGGDAGGSSPPGPGGESPTGGEESDADEAEVPVHQAVVDLLEVLNQNRTLIRDARGNKFEDIDVRLLEVGQEVAFRLFTGEGATVQYPVEIYLRREGNNNVIMRVIFSRDNGPLELIFRIEQQGDMFISLLKGVFEDFTTNVRHIQSIINNKILVIEDDTTRENILNILILINDWYHSLVYR